MVMIYSGPYQQTGKPLVYIDESGFAQDIPRLHGYTKKGERCFGKRNWQAKGRTNVIGELDNQALLAPDADLAGLQNAMRG